MTANHDIRQEAAKAGVKLWEVAEAYGCVDTTFSRKLRRELPQAEKEKIFVIIENLKAEREGVQP